MQHGRLLRPNVSLFFARLPHASRLRHPKSLLTTADFKPQSAKPQSVNRRFYVLRSTPSRAPISNLATFSRDFVHSALPPVGGDRCHVYTTGTGPPRTEPNPCTGDSVSRGIVGGRLHAQGGCRLEIFVFSMVCLSTWPQRFVSIGLATGSG